MNKAEFIDWLSEAYARDAITLGALESGIENTLRLPDAYEIPDHQPWPDGALVRGPYAYDPA